MIFDNMNELKTLFNKITDTSEFEIMFYNYKYNNKLPLTKFMELLNYIKYRSVNELDTKLINNTTLDISYNYANNNNYRITINEIDKINNFLNLVHQRNNCVALSILATQYYNNDNYEFINKIKDNNNIINYDQYDIRFRLSEEVPIDEKIRIKLSNLLSSEAEKIIFRFKQRISLIILDDTKLGKISLDLTIIKFSNSVDKLHDVDKLYEIELEYLKGSEKLSNTIFNKIMDEIYIIKQVLEKSTNIITKDEHNNVISMYKKLLYNVNNIHNTNLFTMQPISLEAQHVVDKLANVYCVTEKSDGDKYQLFIIDNIIYLISNNLVVIKTKYTCKNLNYTVLEGEFIQKNKIYLFMIYDCLIYNNEDIRIEPLLLNRLQYINKFISHMKIDLYEIKNYTGEFNLVSQENFYQTEIQNFYDNINILIKNSKHNDIIFHPKIFLFPTGGDNSEVFSFSNLLWTCCTNNNNIKCPYLVDGIIYTGINQKYTRDKRETKYPIYKYKPPTTNSIDIYITFKKNTETGRYLDIFDNSLTLYGLNKVFRVCNLYVGESIGNNEVPVLFMKEENNHEAFFPLEREEVRDLEGNIVTNNTVIELIYTNDVNIPHQYRWKILRTRWDKTESVIRDKKKYGNFKDNAISIWKSMREAVTINEIKKLSKKETYLYQQQLLLTRIDNKVIISKKSTDAYYQKITDLGAIFRLFHGWIKSCIISNYCQPELESPNSNIIKKKDVLDIGCGRGGDIMKWYHAKANRYVGVDYDLEGLFGSIDSATIRYQNNRSKFPDFTKMEFILADARIRLDLASQEKILPKMTLDNKNSLSKLLNVNKKFNIISYQFSLHYLFESQESINNIIDIHKNYLEIDGYIFCTIFDPNQIMKLLDNKDIYTSWYTDNNGYRKKFFEIIKKFSGNIQNTYGQPIDLHMSWVSQENIYETEYLVTQDYLIDVMKTSNCELIESNFFLNIYNINKEWFTQVIEHEENEKNKKYYKNVAQFYDNLKGADKESKIWNDLYKYYIFKKIS